MFSSPLYLRNKPRSIAITLGVGAAIACLFATRHLYADAIRHYVLREPTPIVGRFNQFKQLVAYEGKVVVARPKITDRTIIAFTFGQSNSANHEEHRFSAESNKVTNYFDGKFYAAADPLLGASGDRGGPWVAMANGLIEQHVTDNVVLVASGIGSTSVQDWRKGGRLYAMLEDRLRRLKPDLRVTHFLWHQGESDNPAIRGKAPTDYADGMHEVIQLTRKYFPHSKFFVAIASRCAPALPSVALQAQQYRVIESEGVYLGPNTDKIGANERFDGCHLSESGQVKHANGWVEAIKSERRLSAGS